MRYQLRYIRIFKVLPLVRDTGIEPVTPTVSR